MAFNVQHVALLMTISVKRLIWLGVGRIDALNLPVLPVSGLCPAVHGSQRVSTTTMAKTVGLYFQFSI